MDAILFLVQLEEADERLLSKFYLASGDVSPMQAVIGSIAAQEVVKVSHVINFLSQLPVLGCLFICYTLLILVEHKF